MIQGLEQHLFRIPVQAGEIVEVLDKGTRLKVQKQEGGTVEIALSRGMSLLKRPRIGYYLVEYPTGHLDILDPVYFASKVASGGADVH